MAVQKRTLLYRRKLQIEPSGGRFARQKFLEQQRVIGNAPRCIALHQRRDFIAEAEQAARLKADDRDIPFNVWRERSERAFRFRSRLVHFSDGKKRPAAAQGSAAVFRLRDSDLIAGRRQHRKRCVDIFALEIAIEGIGK